MGESPHRKPCETSFPRCVDQKVERKKERKNEFRGPLTRRRPKKSENESQSTLFKTAMTLSLSERKDHTNLQPHHEKKAFTGLSVATGPGMNVNVGGWGAKLGGLEAL